MAAGPIHTLIHCQLASQYPTASLDLSKPLSGLADFYFPTCWVQILDAPIDLRLLEKEAVR